MVTFAITVYADCGHEVEIKFGHSTNMQHILDVCKSQCNNTCSSNHRCTLICHYNRGDCESCERLITFARECGHKVKIACGLSEDVHCNEKSCGSNSTMETEHTNEDNDILAVFEKSNPKRKKTDLPLRPGLNAKSQRICNKCSRRIRNPKQRLSNIYENGVVVGKMCGRCYKQIKRQM